MKESRVYLIHIRDCINRIKQYTVEGKEVFFNDIKTQDAVLRNVQVMCESVQKLPNDIVHRVMSAALSTRPEWVIENSRRRAESIMNAGKAEYYHHTAECLKKTRAGYVASNKQAEWRQYYNELLSVHSRKSKLWGF